MILKIIFAYGKVVLTLATSMVIADRYNIGLGEYIILVAVILGLARMWL